MLGTQSCLTLCDPVDCSLPGFSMGFSRQEYWSGLPFPSPGDLPNPGIEPRSPALKADPLLSEPLVETIIFFLLFWNLCFKQRMYISIHFFAFLARLCNFLKLVFYAVICSFSSCMFFCRWSAFSARHIHWMNSLHILSVFWFKKLGS